jgi:two-component system response regulator NreC
MIDLIVAEDHNCLIDGIKLLLESRQDIRLVGSANNGVDLCELVKQKKPHVIVTDIRMPVMDGVTATREILKLRPDTKIIAFTMFGQDEAVRQMFDAGARGYVLKNSTLQDLLSAIHTVVRGEYWYDPSIVVPALHGREKPKGLLSKRQLEILHLIALGKTNQEIADILSLGKTTVETHRKNMIRILNLRGAGELLRYAVEAKYDFEG